MSPDGDPGDDDPRIDSWAEDARARFEARYERMPSWDVPFPQPAFVALAERGLVRGRVLDAGCGTGENALHAAARGHATWGLDLSPTAIGIARSKAAARGLPAARFLVGDALRLELLGLTFDTVLDSGLLHAFTDAERAVYVRSVGRVLVSGGLLHVLCFSDREPGAEGPGPRRVRAGDLRAAFAPERGWRVLAIDEARFSTHIHGPDGARAWIASVERA